MRVDCAPLARSARGWTGHTWHRRDEWQLLNPPQKVKLLTTHSLSRSLQATDFEMIIGRGLARETVT